MSGLQLSVDESCIKKEKEEKQLNRIKVKSIKVEYEESAENQILPNEIDIGPIKLEDNMYNNIKVESEDLISLQQEKATKEKKSNNCRDVLKTFYRPFERQSTLVTNQHKLCDLYNDKNKLNISKKPSISKSEHMCELRQRLINLDNPNNNNIKTTNNKLAKTSRQFKQDFERRLLKLDTVLTLKMNNKPKPKSSAQRMRELRQRRFNILNSNVSSNQSNNQSTNTSPSTPRESSVSRMREFRQRLLDLDKSVKTAKVVN